MKPIYLLNFSICVFYLVVVAVALARLAFRQSRNRQQLPPTEKPKQKTEPIRHRMAAFRATIWTHHYKSKAHVKS